MMTWQSFHYDNTIKMMKLILLAWLYCVQVRDVAWDYPWNRLHSWLFQVKITNVVGFLSVYNFTV